MLTSITCESLVAKNHIFRQIDKLIDLSEIERELSSLYSKICKRGTPLKQSLRMLIVQFMNDYSDRRMEKALQENCPVKWFCGYELQEQTPDHTELFEFAGAAWFSSSEQSKRIIVCFLPFTISDLQRLHKAISAFRHMLSGKRWINYAATADWQSYIFA